LEEGLAGAGFVRTAANSRCMPARAAAALTPERSRNALSASAWLEHRCEHQDHPLRPPSSYTSAALRSWPAVLLEEDPEAPPPSPTSPSVMRLRPVIVPAANGTGRAEARTVVGRAQAALQERADARRVERCRRARRHYFFPSERK
jgi:hypothetical protein